MPSFLPGLDSSTVWDRVKRYAPTGLAVGAGAAGLVGVLGEIKRQRNEAQAQSDLASGKADNDTLVVRVPQKTAGFMSSAANAVRGAGAKLIPKTVTGVGTAVAGLGTAGALVDAGYKAQHAPTPAEVAAQGAAPSSIYQLPLEIGIGGGALAAGYGLVDHLMRRHKQHDLQDELDQAKGDYGDMLGQTLGDPSAKAASLRFPALEGFVAALADELTAPCPVDKTAGLAQFTSVPAGLALLSAAVAHKFVHDQESAADAAHQVKRFAPPKAIRIETVPRPVEQLPLPSAALAPVPMLDDDGSDPDPNKKDKIAGKVAGLGELAELGGVAALAGGKKEKKDGESVEPGEEAAAAKPSSPDPVIHRVSPNQSVIDTEGGSTGVEAADSAAAEVLRHRQGRLARILAASATNAV